jgi:tetratricopeptide (TPR) repeat protein
MIYYDYEEVLLKVDRMVDYGKYVLAKRLLEEVLEKEPGFGPAHFRLGWIYWARLDYFGKAEEHFKLALKFSPEYPLTYYSYTCMLNDMNHSVKLRSVVQNGIKVKGVSRFFLHNVLGKSHEKNSRFEEAHDHYQMAFKYAFMTWQTDEVNMNLKRVREKLKRFEPSNSEKTLSEAQK